MDEQQMMLDELKAFIEAKRAQGYKDEDIHVHVINVDDESEGDQ